MLYAIILISTSVTFLTVAVMNAIDRRKEKKSKDEESSYSLGCFIAPRSSEEENWQIRVVLTTPIGTRCQNYIEIDSKVNECEAVKSAYAQALHFLQRVKF